jgi:hypothetical protein
LTQRRRVIWPGRRPTPEMLEMKYTKFADNVLFFRPTAKFAIVQFWNLEKE